MGYNIGPTIAVKGESEYNAAISKIKTNMKLISSEAAVMTSQFGKNDNSIASLKSKNEILNKSLGEQSKAAKEAENALKKMNEAGVDPTSKAYVEMKTNLNNAKASINDTTKEIEENEAAMSRGSKEVGSFSKGLKDFSSVAGGVALGAAKAFAVGIAAISTAAVFAAKKIYDLTTGAGEWADELLTLSSQTSVSAQTLQEWTYAARFIDTEVESMTKGMSRVVMGMKTATDKGKDYIDVAGGIKIAMTNQDGSMKSTEQVFYDTIDALGGIENATMRDIAAQDIFGKSYQDMKPLIDAGSDSLLRYASEAHSAGIILSDEAVNSLGQFDDQMQRVNARLETAGKLAAVSFLPAVSNIVGGVTDILSTITTALSDGFQEEDIQTISDAITEQLETAIDGIAKNAPAFIGVVTNVLNSLIGMAVDLIPTMLPVLVSAGASLLSGLFQTLQANATPISNAVVQVVTMFVTFLSENLPMIIETGMTILLAVTQGILDNIPTIIPAVVDMITGIALAITDPNTLSQLVVASMQITIAVIQGLIDSLPQLISAALQVVANLAIAFGEAAPQLLESGKEFMIQLDQGIQNKMDEIKTAIGGWINTKIIQPIKDRLTDFLNIGKDMVTGLWNGINDKFQWIKDKIKTWVGDVISYFKGLLGIKSPSTVFAEMGDMSATGYANGLLRSMDKVKIAVGKVKSVAVDAMSGGVTSSLNMTTSASTGARQGVTIGQIVFNQPVESPVQTANLIERRITEVLYA
ncbi:MAG: hypothetical protein VB062_04580 [Christensenella sp.]|nr:hypothetical protein [Christensenella sp.]